MLEREIDCDITGDIIVSIQKSHFIFSLHLACLHLIVIKIM